MIEKSNAVETSRGRDLREGGHWSLGQRWKNHVIYALARVVLWSCLPLPRPWLRALGQCLGALAWIVLPATRRLAIGNVARVFPDASGLARRSFVRLGGELGNVVATLLRKPGKLPALAQDAQQILETARAEGHGVLFVSAHLGAWEDVAATLVAAGIPLTALARESYDPRFTRLYHQLRDSRGVAAIYRGHRGAPMAILRVLKRREVLGIPMDLTGRVPSLAVPFLGIPGLTPLGPARIALRTRASVVVGTVDSSGQVVTATRIATSDLQPGDEAVLLGRINDELSARIRAFPEGWPWMHARWDGCA